MGHVSKVRRKKLFRKLRRISLVVAGVALVVWVFYLGVTWGPRSVDAPARQAAGMDHRELVEESQAREVRFEAIAAYRQPTETELDILREAIRLQREYHSTRRASPEDQRRLEGLESRLGHFVARAIHEKSLAAEQESKRLVEEGKLVEAADRLSAAYELQRQVNQRYGRGEFRDTVRETRLGQEVASIESAPLHQRSVELEAAGQHAVEEFRWKDARQFLSEARELQGRVNDISRRSAYYSPMRFTELGLQIDALKVGEMMSEVQELQTRGKSMEESEHWERAAQNYERAMGLQNQINRDHPQSPFASRDRVTELDTDRQTALSAPQGRRLAVLMTEIRGAIRQGGFEEARPKVEEARRVASNLASRFSQSRYVDPETGFELEFLAMAESALPEMQTMLSENLAPIPGQPDWRMSSAPVSQRLYRRVMNANPSRNLGDELPVDSITLRQARDFCRRASWILARPVELPSKAHFKAALGEWDRAEYEKTSWHQGNSGGSSHPVNTGTVNPHGFSHLVGNLRIWLDDVTENGSAWTAGASYAEEFPDGELFWRIGRNERAPTVGFRYLVGDGVR